MKPKLTEHPASTWDSCTFLTTVTVGHAQRKQRCSEAAVAVWRTPEGVLVGGRCAEHKGSVPT